jgi:hypothetical protein
MPHVSNETYSLNEINELIDGKTEEARQRMKTTEDTINKMPRIHIGKYAPSPQDMREGDLYFEIV